MKGGDESIDKFVPKKYKPEHQKDETSCWVRVYSPDYSAKKEGEGGLSPCTRVIRYALHASRGPPVLG